MGFNSSGSMVPSQGAASAATSMTSRKQAPPTMVGLRLSVRRRGAVRGWSSTAWIGAVAVTIMTAMFS